MIDTLAALSLTVWDRARGHTWPIKGASMLAKIAYGYAMALAFGHYADWTAALITVGMAAGMSIGWGNPLGSAILGIKMDQTTLERWQTFKLVKNDPWLALAYRGAIWGGCVAIAAACLDLRLLWLIPSYAVAMPAAVELALMMGKKGDEAWAASEFWRGGIVGVIVLLVTV
jgi:hypothetical protein